MPFWYNGWLVALADVLAGCFVLTSLARQDVKHTSAKLIAVCCRLRPSQLLVIGNPHAGGNMTGNA